MKNDDNNGRAVGGGVGAAGGAVTGLAVGASAGGPVGAVVGSAVGAVAGMAAGVGIAVAVDPAVEEEYWSKNFQSRPYVKDGAHYDEYSDAYRYGWESRAQSTSPWDTAADDVEQGWDKGKGRSSMAWPDAKDAVRDGWQRVDDSAADADHHNR